MLSRSRIVGITLAVSAGIALSQNSAEKPYGIPKRVNWTTSKVVGSPEPPRKYRLTRAFPQVSFKNPVFIAQEPTSERFMVAEYETGRIYSFLPNDPTGKKDLFLEIKRGISAFSFHPKYKENGYIFLFSHLDPKIKAKQMSRVFRYQVEPGSNPPRIKAGSETMIVEWPAGGHNGGEAIIGPDGYLYITTGDGTSGSDVNNTGQSMNDLFAVMMRLDVDHPDAGRNYSIPKDNPFINMPDARPEVWAYGFRNPWRFSFDPHTGQPWVGDVGQDIWEMIELVSKGSNHGWSVMEGTHPFHPNSKRGPTPFVAPIVEHHHTEARSITGGYVYQGAKFPELRDVYLYGDYQYGKMWGLRYDHSAKKVISHEELADTNVKIAGFGMGRDGSFYAVDYDRGQIFELERQPPPTAPLPKFPRKLSETGLFTSVVKHEIAPGVLPYSINAPFWSDGAYKERFFALPPDTKVVFHETKPWDFPDGAVTMKSFWLDMEEGNPQSRKRIETRIVVKQNDRWVGYSYLWNDQQADADLVEAAGIDKTYVIKSASGTKKQVWHYPSRNECMFCHSRAAGFVLGLSTAQMNRDHKYESVADNQLRSLSHAGYFKTAIAKATTSLPAYPDPVDPKADLNARAKAYLQVNCSMCHVADGGGNSKIELGFKTPLAKSNMVDEVPMHDVFGIANAKLIAPGDPQRSVLYHRMSIRGEGQMPPTSSNRVDEAGAKLLREWITQLPKK